MTINTRFESKLYDLIQYAYKLCEQYPENETARELLFGINELEAIYERQQEENKREEQKSVKQLLNTIIRVLHDENY